MLSPVEINSLCCVSWRAKNRLLNCIEWVYVCMRACVWHSPRAPMVLMHINVTILSAVRCRPLIQVSFHVHYLAPYCDIRPTPFEIHHTAWQIARSIIVLVKRFDCENCNTKTNVLSHLLSYIGPISMSSYRWFDSHCDRPTLSSTSTRYINRITW